MDHSFILKMNKSKMAAVKTVNFATFHIYINIKSGETSLYDTA